ncbi:hypothetical protein V6N13_036896 [Hibiscus sabdariffa]
MLLLSQLLLTKERFESCKIQVFCIPEEDSDAEGLKADVKKFLYDLRMQAEQQRKKESPLMADGKAVIVNEQQVEKFLYTTLKLNSTILRYSRMVAVVLVSLPAPLTSHPAYCYMEYMDLLVDNLPRLLMVRGYGRDVVTLFT